MFDQIYITGFKAFQGVDKNPTQLIAEEFMKKPHPKVTKVTCLDVTVKDVDEYVQKIKAQTKEKEEKILDLHLGVGPNTVYFLQKCCYNNKNFSVPDNNGYQCFNTKICEHLELDEAIQTPLDLQYAANKLTKGHQVEISTNPGRYLCNYVYYASSNRLCDNKNVTSLFIHFPGLTIKTHEQNMKFMEDFLNLMTIK